MAAPPLSSKSRPFFCDFLAHLLNIPELGQAVPWLNKPVEQINKAGCGAGKSVLSLDLGFFLRPREVGAWDCWGPFLRCDLSKLPMERKTPELPGQREPPSFSLHGAAKGWEKGDLFTANAETEGTHLLIHSSDTKCPICAGCYADPSLKEHTRSYKSSS